MGAGTDVLNPISECVPSHGYKQDEQPVGKYAHIELNSRSETLGCSSANADSTKVKCQTSSALLSTPMPSIASLSSGRLHILRRMRQTCRAMPWGAHYAWTNHCASSLAALHGTRMLASCR